MNADALLALIADLYAQLRALTAEVERLQEEVRRLKAPSEPEQD